MKVFIEEQRFTQTWLIVLLSVSIIVAITLLIQDYLKEGSAVSVNQLVLNILLILVTISLLFFFKLKTRIDEKGVYYQFLPFHLKTRFITWSEIEKAYVRNYDSISEYGGWGIKGGFFWNKKKGIAVNVSGDIGLQLELKTGKKILIGTQKENEVKQVLATYKN